MVTSNGAVASQTLGAGQPSRKKTARPRKRVTAGARSRRSIGKQALQVAHRSVKRFRDSAAEFAEEGHDKVHGIEHSVRKFVREQPFKSALIGASLALAAGAGVLVGRFLWMRREPTADAISRHRW